MDDELLSDLLAAVEQQIESPQTRYVAEAFERLCDSGVDPAGARRSIAEVLGVFTDRMLEDREPFDEEAYRQVLAGLG
jgi:hypothetical protein